MAMNITTLSAIADIARQWSIGKIACLGYPDMLVTEQQLDAVCGLDGILFRQDAASIISWHKLGSHLTNVAETRSVLGKLMLSADFFDIHSSRGDEIEIDLNEPISADFCGKYDIVFDGGTMEHCFNVGQVMKNILRMCRVGGHIVHSNPMNMQNHGFYNFSPTFYYDWYAQNGHDIKGELCIAMHGPSLNPKLIGMSHTVRFNGIPDCATSVVVASKKNDNEPKWPMQTKYIKNAELRGAA